MLNKICMVCLNSSSDTVFGWNSAYFSLSILLFALHRLWACWTSIMLSHLTVLLFCFLHESSLIVRKQIMSWWTLESIFTLFWHCVFFTCSAYSYFSCESWVCSELVRETLSKIIICHQAVRYGFYLKFAKSAIIIATKA